MLFLRALGAGFGIIVSLVVFTLVYAFLQPGPREKATGIMVLLASPYYWILMILPVACEAWLLMRHGAS